MWNIQSEIAYIENDLMYRENPGKYYDEYEGYKWGLLLGVLIQEVREWVMEIRNSEQMRDNILSKRLKTLLSDTKYFDVLVGYLDYLDLSKFMNKWTM